MSAEVPTVSWIARTLRLALESSPLTRGGLVVALGLTMSGCTRAQLHGQSPAYVIVRSLEGAPGADAATFDYTLRSDVSTNGVVLEDMGRVSFALALRDPGAAALPQSPTPSNFISFARYHVRFSRADGRDTAGVDVPHPFDAAMTLTVDAGGAVGTFTLVRLQSKLEPPLLALRNQGGAVAISTIAEVTFHGADQAGRPVSALGRISVNFADWADPV
jgi:hypothetical protein